MSSKSFLQILILLLIALIIGGIYYKYFSIDKNIVEEINTKDIEKSSKIEELEKKISELEIEKDILNNKIARSNENSEQMKSDNNSAKENNKISKNLEKKIDKKNNIKEIKKKEIKNLVKDVEYTSVDEKGNKFYLKAKSGKSNFNNKDILDLENVRGKVISEVRDTIYIVSDFAQYNSLNLNSKFYENVIINYQDKEIKCINFDINMETNKAIAYNNVIITDPKSEMKAGIVEFDLKTKNIEINPESAITEIKVVNN
jgi:lipopolysaccharide export system protein LptC